MSLPAAVLLPVLLAVLRLAATVVTLAVATLGSWGLAFGVLTACTSTTPDCGATRAVVYLGWALQVALLLLALASWLPRLRRRVPALGQALLAVALVALPVPLLAATAVVAEHSYCLPGRDDRPRDDYCHVALQSPSARR